MCGLRYYDTLIPNVLIPYSGTYISNINISCIVIIFIKL